MVDGGQKTEMEFKKKKPYKNNKRKWNWLGSDIQLRILLLLLGF